MLSIDPSTTKDDFIRQAAGLRDAGFAAAYIFAKDITEPSEIIDLLGSAVPELLSRGHPPIPRDRLRHPSPPLNCASEPGPAPRSCPGAVRTP